MKNNFADASFFDKFSEIIRFGNLRLDIIASKQGGMITLEENLSGIPNELVEWELLPWAANRFFIYADNIDWEYENAKTVEKIVDKLLELVKLTIEACLLYTSPSPRDQRGSRMPSSA